MVARGDYGVEAGRRAGAADAEGHDLPRHPGGEARDHRDADARVDDRLARADARRGHRRRQRGDRRHLRGDALGRDERRRLSGRGRPRDGRDRRGRRSRPDRRPRSERSPTRRPRRSCTPRSSSPTNSTPPRSSSRPPPAARARACAKHRSRRPIVALAHDPPVADQLTLEWGVYPTSAVDRENVDEMIDAALTTARDAAGIPSGARWYSQPGADRHAGRHQPHHGARDPMSVPRPAHLRPAGQRGPGRARA